jgi:hypothetical protein
MAVMNLEGGFIMAVKNKANAVGLRATVHRVPPRRRPAGAARTQTPPTALPNPAAATRNESPPAYAHPCRNRDLNWAEDRFLVHSPKTEHIEGKAERMVPLFPELRQYLLEAYEQANSGDKFLITRYRGTDVNLGTQAHRIIKQAGLVPWPKTFQNLRASRETELVESFPVHVVTDWLGNSPQIAARHYLQTTEDHFKKAVQNPVQSTAVWGRLSSQNKNQKKTN